MPEAVVVSACRTAIGTYRKGTLADTSAFDLADAVVEASVKRSGLSADQIDDVILGEAMYGGGDVARHAAVSSGMTGVPGVAMNRHCATGLTAVATAAAGIRAGMDDVVLAGGVESRSTAPVLRWREPGTENWLEDWMSPSHPDRPDAPNRDMTITVGWNAAQEVGVTREEMDAWALRSHERAIRAIDEGRFVDEIVPLRVRRPDGVETTFEIDEHPRRGSTMEKLAALKPLHPEIPGFSITAGNSSGINDAAAAVMLTSDEVAAAQGLEPLAVIRSWTAVGVDPVRTGLAPTLAIPKALRRAGLELADVDLFEINEAFAAMAVASTRVLGIDEEIVNVSGSGVSLGHPVAATGARMVVTLVHELRRRGGGIGVVSMCAGGGMGAAMVLEVPAPRSA
ncbi:MAG: acetyl-CoA acetyltransferase [Frankiales bacterium]|nr:acetyl-CoA acetyltransferase [Frankiales bacterium]